MTKKNRLIWLLWGLALYMSLGGGIVEAATSAVNGSTTIVGVEFEQTTDSSGTKPPKPKPPVIDGGGHKVNPQILPKTGEVITSLIIMLLGVSIAVFVLGIVILKQVYQEQQEMSWE